MIIKGHSTSGFGLGNYLQKTVQNERVEIWPTRGDMQRDLSETLNDWRSDSLTTSCSKPLYHAQLSPDRTLSSEEWNVALDIFEKEMGLENQLRVLVKHVKKGREHVHAVYSRINENGYAISDSWNFWHHEKTAREIEITLGLEKNQGVFISRKANRPERTPSQAAIQQAERLKLDLKQIKRMVRKLYQNADNGHSFVAELESEGYRLAHGDQGGYVIVDNVGGVHSLLRVVDVKADLLRETLRDYGLQNLPSVQAARSAQQMRQLALLVEKQEAKIELYSGTQHEKQATKSLTLAERIQKTQQDLLNQREKRKRGEAIISYDLSRGLGLNRHR
ncbi:MAG: relaxase/mobilization nuclease domain-containing protein [Methylobacter sp.]|nr:relaxase/mobilization nuclease domain-containing protein [Methylobacter sp.]